MLALSSMSILAYDAEVDGIYYNFSDDEATVTYRSTSGNSYSGTVIIPEFVTYNGKLYSVTGIGYRAFYNCSSLTLITIPNSVTSIGSTAFKGCSSLTSVTIPNSVTSIDDYAFSGCNNLISVTLESNSIVSASRTSTSSMESIFGSQVKTYIFGPSISVIGSYAFYGCSELISITIPGAITSIGSNAFSGCDNLTSVTLESDAIVSASRTYQSSMKSIFGEQVKTYILGSSISVIGSCAFYGCSSLTSVVIPESVTSIGYSAFYGCSGLTSVHITDLASWCKISFAVSGSSDYQNNPLYYAQRLFLNGQEIKDLVIPDSVTSISNYAFYGCTGLISITIPNSVTSIGNYAFAYCI